MAKLYPPALIIFLVFSSALFSCKKDSFITSSNASVTLTADSIKFDTVFTTTGSVTQLFKIINENNQKLLLSDVKLMGGSASAFKININGVQTIETTNIGIAANDSIYVFVSVFVNPTSGNLPFVLSDSILISYNGNNRFVQLEAYGQNAHFLNSQVITGNQLWQNDLPYVILGGLRIDTTASLAIAEGCKIYLHANAPFLVDGTLTIRGSKSNPVQFTGDRLDDYYKDLPASWPGIYFRATSKDNELSFALVKNASQAINVQDPSLNSNPKLVLHQCIIDNAFDAGLFSSNSTIDADNCLISNCTNNLFFQLGGSYNFTNCTVASFSNSFLLHTTPVLQITDADVQDGSPITADLSATFTNCIFWGDDGSIGDEVITDKEGSGLFLVTLRNCLYRAVNDPSNTTLEAVIKNQYPSFDSIDAGNKYFDFRITKDLLAPGIDNGTIVAFPTDLDSNARNVGIPDIGSYEKQ